MNRRSLLVAASLTVASVGLGGFYWGRRWKYIVIHHSASSFGDIPFLQRVHRERQANDPIDAIPYHYVIGNGNGMPMGHVASDWRQSYGLWGAHVSGNNSDRNFRGIGICLIGNFEREKIPPLQYASLLRLTKGLMTKHDIPVGNISGHGLIPGESTKCPGKHFPMSQFLQDIAAS